MKNRFIAPRIAVFAAAFIFFAAPAIFAGGFAGAEEFISPVEEAFPQTEFYLGRVIEIKESMREEFGFGYTVREVAAEIIRGEKKGERLFIEQGVVSALPDYQKIKIGDRIVIAKAEAFGQIDYYVADRYRLPPLGIMLAIFFGAVIFFGRWRGLTSVVGLVLTILILAKFIVPRIIAGGEPLTAALTGSFAIAILAIYTAHGLNKRTSIAVLATIITLGAAAGLAIAFVSFSKLFGGGTEEAFFLQIGVLEMINLRGLLLAGIIIGALGVLDDITTSQSAVVDEIKKANPSLRFGELYRRGISVGNEHIASLVNTLVLAYAGASLPLFLLFSISDNPLWVTVNSEFIAEEIVRTLVGSTALVLAVPVSTFLAAYFFGKSGKESSVGLARE